MLTTAKTEKAKKAKKPKSAVKSSTIVFKTHEEAAKYIASKVKPVGRSPKGRAIYAYEDLKKLDIRYPDDVD